MKKKAYISKRLVARVSRRIFKSAADKALIDNGYVIIAKDGWIVKEYANGDIEKLKEIDSSSITQELALD